MTDTPNYGSISGYFGAMFVVSGQSLLIIYPNASGTYVTYPGASGIAPRITQGFQTTLNNRS